MIMSRLRRRISSAAPASTSPGHDLSGNAQGSTSQSARQRHAIFYDVENTSSPDDVGGVVDQLAMDRQGCDTQLVAVGNWRVIGQQTARLLARQGAELVHSAPSTGVRDWSDLRIAVDAGIWLAAARPGDKLHIISDDQAFDAVGDVAATLGVEFQRIAPRKQREEQRAAARASARTAPSTVATGASRPTAGASRPTAGASRPTAGVSRPTAGVSRPTTDDGRHATHQDILSAVRKLTSADASGDGVSLDSLSNALKDEGFRRAPGSLRLITRLRRIKELQVRGDGVIRLASPMATPMATPVAAEPANDGDGPAAPRKRARRGRRGGRRRSGRQQDTDTNGSAPEANDTTS
jgi:hypothetical protein